jgi:hypothetical protein
MFEMRANQGMIPLYHHGYQTSEDGNVYRQRAHLHNSIVNIQCYAYKNDDK